ncbi:hypothetical protein ACQB60_38150 [Actinomycetota bacterium Odt1-20B]
MTTPSTPTAPSTPATPAAPNSPGLGRLWTLLGTVVAPTTLVTALLYYFGWNHAWWFFNYFGVSSTVLGFSTIDYLMRSLDALFIPMTVTAGAGLLAFWGHDLLRRRLARGAEPRVLRILVPVMAGTGALLALGGFWAVVSPAFFLNRALVLAPLSLGLGVALLSYTLHLWRVVLNYRWQDDSSQEPEDTAGPADPGDSEDPIAPVDPEDADNPPASPAPTTTPPPPPTRPEWATLAEWAIVFSLIALSLFWAATNYAAAAGETRARRFVAGLPTDPYAILYSADSLSLSAPGVRETRCHDAKAAYRFRYDGLKLVLQSGNQYVFVPERWTPVDGVAVLIPRSDSVRLEFAPPSAGGAQPPHPRC